MKKFLKWIFVIASFTTLAFTIAFWVNGGSILIKGYLFTSKSDLQFANGKTTLSGTLWKPSSAEKPPAVVLIHGSGPSSREDLNWYAAKLCMQGYAALVYDKRGVGESGGSKDSWRYFNFDSLAGDALAGVTYLQGRTDIDTSRIGLLGISQGGWIAPIAASKARFDIKFLILISASITTVAEDRLFERARRLKREGFTTDEIEQVKEMQLLDQEFTRNPLVYDDFVQAWNKNRSARWFQRVYLSDTPIGSEHKWRKWYKTIVDFTPLPLLRELTMPVVFVFGDSNLDPLSPVNLSIQNIKSLPNQQRYNILQFNGYDHNIYKEALWGLAPNHASWEKPGFKWISQRIN